MRNMQQYGKLGRGNPLTEQMYGGLMRGLMPQGISLPQVNQINQGGYGGMGKLAPGSGYNRAQRFGTTPNLKKYLMQYSRYGKRLNKNLKTNSLLKY